VITVVRWGIGTLLASAALLAWSCWLLPPGAPRWVGVAVAALLWLFVLNFFRNPRRTPQGDARCIVAAADGVVSDIEELEEHDFVGARCVRIGIFLNVFDVHVNRSCIDGTIGYASYQPGRFLDARHPSATHANEANTLGIEADPAVAGGFRLLLRQISGLIARRIVCTHGVGDRLGRGELFGMIKFGSRTELWLPQERVELAVAVGQRVRCGETVVARIRAEQTAEKQ